MGGGYKKIKKNINHNSNDILTTIEGAKEYFNINNRQLRLNIPQYYLKPRDWFSVPPHLWEDGLPAFMVNYQFNEYRTNRVIILATVSFFPLRAL